VNYNHAKITLIQGVVVFTLFWKTDVAVPVLLFAKLSHYDLRILYS
jgi:hypothetical protein